MKSILALTAVALASVTTLAVAQSAPATGGHRGAFMERLKAADTNGDGMISQSEAAALPHLAKHFDAIDANHDGQVTVDELHAFMQAKRGQFAQKGFAMLDTNGDGKVSRDEFLAQAAARFDRMDANKDGVLTPDELKAGHHGHRGR